MAYMIFGQMKLAQQTAVVNARLHNNRERGVTNADPGGPAPVVIYGPVDTWQGVKDRLAELEIKPRKGAVLAMELLFTTSPEYWHTDEHVQQIQRATFERLVRQYLDDRFVPEALVSITWHLDETTPHLHVIVVPVRQRVDQRFADRGFRWTLCARGDTLAKGDKDYASAWRGGMGGKGHMSFEQSKVAEIVGKPIGLARGKLWSGAKNKPNRVYQAEMAEAIGGFNAKAEGLAADRVALASERDSLADQADLITRREAMLGLREAELASRLQRVDDAQQDCATRERSLSGKGRQLADDRARLASEREAFEAEVTRRQAELDVEAQRIAAAEAEIDARRRRAAEWTKRAQAREDKIKADQQLLTDRLEATRKLQAMLSEVRYELALLEDHGYPGVRSALTMLRQAGSEVAQTTVRDHVLAAVLGRPGMGRA